MKKILFYLLGIICVLAISFYIGLGKKEVPHTHSPNGEPHAETPRVPKTTEETTDSSVASDESNVEVATTDEVEFTDMPEQAEQPEVPDRQTVDVKPVILYDGIQIVFQFNILYRTSELFSNV